VLAEMLSGSAIAELINILGRQVLVGRKEELSFAFVLFNKCQLRHVIVGIHGADMSKIKAVAGMS
jgi:hypothetical protein